MNTMDFDIVVNSQYAGRISRLYDRLARMYDLFTDHEPAHHRKAVELAGIAEDSAVLEVACGTGRGTLEIAKRIGANGRFHAVDLTEAMLEKAKARLRKYNLLARVDIKSGDARALPFPDGTFDLVYNAYMFDLIDAHEIPAVVSEFKRLLKPGGKLVLVNMSKNRKGRTLYEFLYEKGLLGFASGSCRPVFLKPFLKEAGFEDVERIYRKNCSWFFLNMLTGTEIVIGTKSKEGTR